MSYLLEGGELVDRVIEKESYSEADARTVMATLLDAVAYLHSRGIAHRDIKPQNVLLRTKEDDTSIVLVDFGFSKELEVERRSGSARSARAAGAEGLSSRSSALTDSGRSMNEGGISNQSGRAAAAAGHGPHARLVRMDSVCGTPKYVAPEVLDGRPYLLECDVWYQARRAPCIATARCGLRLRPWCVAAHRLVVPALSSYGGASLSDMLAARCVSPPPRPPPPSP